MTDKPKMVSFLVDQALAAKLEAIAQYSDRSKSACLRELLRKAEVVDSEVTIKGGRPVVTG